MRIYLLGLAVLQVAGKDDGISTLGVDTVSKLLQQVLA